MKKNSQKVMFRSLWGFMRALCEKSRWECASLEMGDLTVVWTIQMESGK